MKAVPAPFLPPFLIDPHVLSWNGISDPSTSDFGKKTLEILATLHMDPRSLPTENVRDLVWHPDSQIGQKELHWSHIYHTAHINKQLVDALGIALQERGGFQRALRYKQVVVELLTGDIDQYRETTPHLFRQQPLGAPHACL